MAKSITDVELYHAAYEYLLKDRESQFIATVRNKPDSRQAADHAKAVIRLVERGNNLEMLEAYAKELKKNKNSAATVEPFSLTDV